ncbi:hypothetical protein QBZ16_004774 [Prototheca wickerhamii]|uniref:Enoyl reductase (ER) domain-containing protein n=1 Tax=Prototheca wickerhamii TaxID=3111 RepID=A0AAD9IH59_PROWI|nr:hypothetical protein QBZ16_004774 [Prototheca wickerhamii]
MDLEHLRGQSAFVTGAGSGIGRALTLELASLGVDVTAADLNLAGAQETAAQARGARVTAVQLDVCSPAAQEAAVAAHVKRHGSLDIAVLNAGIGERGDVTSVSDDSWRPTLDVDLTAVLDGVRVCTRAMAPGGGRRARQGVILTVASAGAFFVMPPAPVYAAAKAGVAHATRSLALPLLQKHNVRIAALCPEFTETALVKENRAAAHPDSAFARAIAQPLLTVAQVVEAGVALIGDPARVGQCLVVRLRAVAVHTLSNDFRAATRLESWPLPATVPKESVIVRTAYAGVNASDVNYSSGRYHKSVAEARAALPYVAGFEAVSVIAAVGEGVRGYRVGDAVATMEAGNFSEFAVVPARALHRVPSPRPEFLALLTSGLTASIGLQEAGRLRRGETVLVTAAAGGTGQFVVQLAKRMGCHVIATVGSADKADLVRSLGADRAIDYRREDVKAVLRKEYPRGVDVVWESIGGDMFATCVNALATSGRLIVIGAMSQYKAEGGWQPQPHVGLPEKLLARNATVVGFFLPVYTHLMKDHLARLTRDYTDGKLRIVMDERRFEGVEQVPDAVDRLQSGKSAGKVYIRIASDPVPVGDAKL